MVRTQKLKNFKVNPIDNSTHKPPQIDNLPTLHGIFLATAVRNSGKSQAVADLIRKYGKAFDVVKIICPTWESNEKLFESILKKPPPEDEDRVDVYTEANNADLQSFVDYLEEEKEDLDRYHQEMEEWNLFQKQLKTLSIANVSDDLIMQFYDEVQDKYIKPHHKWGGKPPSVALLIDDCMASELLKPHNKAFIRFCVCHRHLFGIGCSIFLTTQAFKCLGGLAKAVRTNLCAVMMWRNHNPKEYDAIKEECTAEIPPEIFDAAYKYAVDNDANSGYDFLFIDFFPKDIHPSPLRKNFDEFIMVDDLKKKNV